MSTRRQSQRRASSSHPRRPEPLESTQSFGSSSSSLQRSHSRHAQRGSMAGPPLRRVDSTGVPTMIGGSSSHQRPRPISTGRIRDPDSKAVTMAILELREQREQRERRNSKKKSHYDEKKEADPVLRSPYSRPQQMVSPAASAHTNHSNPRFASPRTSTPRTATTNTPRSTKINYPTTPRAIPTTPASAATRKSSLPQQMPLTPHSMGAANTNAGEEQFKLKQAHDRITQLSQELEDLKFFQEIEDSDILAAPPATKKLAGCPPPVPQVITAVASSSPSHRQRQQSSLPPPPPELPSPRKLSALDRTSLELEAQTLVRRIQDLMKEKTQYLSKQQHQQQQDEQAVQKRIAAEVQQREQELKAQLEQAFLQEKQQLEGFHQAQLQDMAQQQQMVVSSLQDQVQFAQKDAELQVQQLETKLSTLKSQTLHLEGKYSTAKAQLQSYKDQVREKEIELQVLADELEETQQNQQHEEEIAKLQDMIDQQQQEHLLEVQALKSELSSQKEAFQEELETLKKTQDEREKRKLSDLVEWQSSSRQEYERRLATLQEQLTLATDRHAHELEQKVADLETKQQAWKTQQEREWQSQHQAKIQQLQETIERLQKELQSNLLEEEASVKSREQELLQDKQQIDDLHRQLDVSQQTVEDLKTKLNQQEKQSLASLAELESKHNTTLMERDEMLSNQRKTFQKMQAQHERELAAKQEDYDDLKTTNQERMDLLTKELEQARLDFEASLQDDGCVRMQLEHRVSELQQALEASQKESKDLQVQMESSAANLRVQVAKLEGKLQASESTLQQKRAFIEVLEDRLELMAKDSEKQESQQIRALQEDLETYKSCLDEERATSQQRMDSIAKLEKETSQLKTKLAEQSKFRGQLESLRKELATVQDEKLAQSVEFSKLRQEYQDIVKQMEESRRKHSIELDDVISAKERKEKQIKESESKFKQTLSELEKNLLEKSRANEALQLEVERQKRDYQKVSNTADEAVVLRERIASLEKKVELHRTIAAEAEIKADEAQKTYREELLQQEVRKEKQIKEVTDHFRKEVAELETSLKEQTNAKGDFQIEIAKLKREVERYSVEASECEALRAKVASLEKSVAAQRSLAEEVESTTNSTSKSLRERLAATENQLDETEKKLAKAEMDKTEVVQALENLIHEVQSREEEINSLSDMLNKREEELGHAKLIATKAIASAQEIRSRYKDRRSDLQIQLQEEVNELRGSLDYLTNKNDNLQRRTTLLERELRDRDMECVRLKDQLRGGEHSIRSRMTKPDYTKPEVEDRVFNRTNSTYTNTTGEGYDSFEDHASDVSNYHQHESMSTATADIGEPSKWFHDFDSDSRSSGFDSYDGAKSEPGSKEARRSMERDALRKYVRKRYLKHKEQR